MRGSNSNQTVDQNRLREEPPTSSITPSPPRLPPPQPVIRYRECLKNHAASMGGHVTDGCGEFMPSGEEGTEESLKCAACECHRSFHRREAEGGSEPPSGSVPVPYYQYNIHMSNSNLAQRGTVGHIVVPPPPLPPPAAPQYRQGRAAMPPVMMAFGGGIAAESSSEDLNLIHGGVGGQSTSKKRFRTKFTQEQKRRMEEFAERIEWKIPKQNESEVQQFCAEVGINRQVFKVWMHNCKQASKKKQL